MSVLSAKVLGIQWKAKGPFLLATLPSGSSVQLELSNFEEVSSFIAGLSPEVRGEQSDTSFLIKNAPTEARINYYREVADFFVFRESPSQKIVGVFVGNIEDWSTYYLRYAVVLPEYRALNIWQKSLHRIFSVLVEHGVERVEGQVSSANNVNIHVFNKLGFIVTGFQVSERWGALIRFTKFLSGKHEGAFLSQLCTGKRQEERRTK